MPVKKFRSVEDMTSLPARTLDPSNFRIAIELSRLCIGLSGKRLRPGVYKYRSITAANEARAATDRER